MYYMWLVHVMTMEIPNHIPNEGILKSVENISVDLELQPIEEITSE